MIAAMPRRSLYGYFYHSGFLKHGLLLAECLKCIRESPPTFRREIIIVDNASRDHSAEFIRTHHSECRLIAKSEVVGLITTRGPQIEALKIESELLYFRNMPNDLRAAATGRGGLPRESLQ